MEHIQRVGDDDPTYTVPYVPEERKRHRWEDLFMDIPLKMERGLDGLYAAAGGPLLLPHTAARLAEHVELCGFGDPDESAARIRRVDLPRGAFRWQDVKVAIPDVDPVDKVHTVANAALTPAERADLIERLQNDLTP